MLPELHLLAGPRVTHGAVELAARGDAHGEVTRDALARTGVEVGTCRDKESVHLRARGACISQGLLALLPCHTWERHHEAGLASSLLFCTGQAQNEATQMHSSCHECPLLPCSLLPYTQCSYTASVLGFGTRGQVGFLATLLGAAQRQCRQELSIMGKMLKSNSG